MAFDVGAGLAQMGETSSKFAGLAALEQQKSGLEGERLKLANDLAMTRESAGRQQQHGLDLETLGKTQAFTSAENTKAQAAELERTKIMASATAATAGAHLQGIRLQIEAMERQPEYKTLADGTIVTIPKKAGIDASGNPLPIKAMPVIGADGEPLKASRPEEAKAATEALSALKLQQQSALSRYEVELKTASHTLEALTKQGGALLDDPKKGITTYADAVKAVQDVNARYKPEIDDLNQQIKTITGQFQQKAGMTPKTPAPGPPPLGNIVKVPAPGAPAPPGAGAPKPPGMINGVFEGPG